MSEQKTNDALQALYATLPADTRSDFGGNESVALEYYDDFVSFIGAASLKAGIDPKGARLLDIGCGCGWSTFSFARKGYVATGIDLNAADFEPPQAENLTLLEGSGIDVKFPDASFDVGVSYQCIELVPDPEKMLREMTRVCVPGGIVAIVGPNILNPIGPLHQIVGGLKRGALPLRRTAGMPRHPYGNTLPEHLLAGPKVVTTLIGKLLNASPSFTMRVPDLQPPFHSDNDSCYLCNPVDFVRWFPKNGCEVFQVGKYGRPAGTYLFASGTWFVAKKHAKATAAS